MAEAPGKQEQQKSINDVVFNLSDYATRQHKNDEAVLHGMPQNADRTLATKRSRDSLSVKTALAENKLDDPKIQQVLYERLTELRNELEATRVALEKLRNSPAEYQKASANYEARFKYYQGVNRNYQEFSQSRDRLVQKPIIPEAQQQKLVRLEFPPKEQLLPAGNEQGAWSSGNARFVERALFRSFAAMGINLPFSPDDIDSGMARDITKHPLPRDYKPANGQPPVLWLEYGLQEQNDRGFLVRVPHSINSPNELVQTIESFSKIGMDPMINIAINMRKDVAVQLTSDNLR